MRKISGDNNSKNNPIKETEASSQKITKTTNNVPRPSRPEIESFGAGLSSRNVQKMTSASQSADLDSKQSDIRNNLFRILNEIMPESPIAIRLKTIQSLIENINILIKNETLLTWACKKGDVSKIEMLLELNANINEKNSGSETPLICAAKRGYVEIVRLLLDREGIQLDLKTNPGETALSLVCKVDSIESKKVLNIVQLLLGKLTDLHRDIGQGNALLFTCHRLKKAIEPDKIQNFIEIVQLLLSRGADPNASLAGYTPLLILCSQSNPDLRAIDLLLGAGANINICLKGYPAFTFAVRNPNPSVRIPLMEKLIEKGVNVNTKISTGSTKYTLLEIILGLKLEYVEEVIDFLLRKGAELNLLSPISWDFLEEEMEKNTKFSPKLLQDLVDSDKKTLELATEDRGKTPFMYAAASGILPIAKYMLDLGVPLHRQDASGFTALDYAIAYGRVEMGHLLQTDIETEHMKMPKLVMPGIHISENIYGPVNQELGNAMRDMLVSKSPVEVTGITFQGEVVKELEGGACTSLTMRGIESYFLATKETNCSWDSILEHIKEVTDVAILDWEHIRTEQAAYNTLRIINPNLEVDYPLSKVQAVMNFRNWEIIHSSKEIDITDYSQALPLLQQEIATLPNGMFAFRILQPADNEKLEVHGHTGFYLKMEGHSAIFDPNVGLLDLTGTGADAKVMLIQSQDLYDRYSVKLLRLYELIDSTTASR